MDGKRPRWFRVAIWVIPIVTWILLNLIFSLPAPMKEVVQSEDVTVIRAVEDYLQQEGIAYACEGHRVILVDSQNHDYVAALLENNIPDLKVKSVQ